MSKLNFPKKDRRSDGEPFVRNRPWIKQGASLTEVYVKRILSYFYCPIVHFDDAPRNVTDMVSRDYIK